MKLESKRLLFTGIVLGQHHT